METLGKGKLTRKTILDAAREIFNEKGINLTIDNLASEMEVTKGKITNHFATKDKLFLAILADYEEQLGNTLASLREQYESKTLGSVMSLISPIMDLQFEYRCSIIYLNVLSPGQSELREHTRRNAAKNIEAIRNRISLMVNNKLLKEEILEKDAFDAFIFIYINQLTQWVVYFDMYDQDRSFKKMKLVYLRGIMHHVYGPYLTEKGRKELENLKYK
jgi:AcrR family transcriptional regulator